MGQRRYFSPEAMKKIAEEAIAEGNISLIARRYDVTRHAVARWVADYRQGRLGAAEMLSATAVDRIIAENRELKRLLGDKELQLEIMRDLLKKTAQRAGTKPK